MTGKQKKQEKSADADKTSLLKDVLRGDVISSNFFIRHKIMLILCIFLLMLFIAFKYECQTHMETIKKLETELSVIKTRSIYERSTYMSRTCESSMQHLVDSLNLNLSVQDKPPFKLKY